MPIHLQPTAELAERVLLPGDPGRALRLAQALLDGPRMFNHERGLWGYTGTADDGAPLTIQSTGMGGPSAAIVITELVQLGARRLIRVGTCGAFDRKLELGSLLIADAALATDGASRALGTDGRIAADSSLTEALKASGQAKAVLIASTDLFYGSDDESLIEAGTQAVDMETAALLTLSQKHGARAASLLIVSDRILPRRERISREALHDAERRAGQVAAAALR